MVDYDVLRSYLLGFLGVDGAGMVVDVVGGRRGDIIVIEQCLVRF